MLIAHFPLTIEQAYDLTPRETFTYMKAMGLQRRQLAEFTIWGAIADRRKTIPTLAEITGEEKSPQRLPTREEFDRRRAEFRREMDAKFPGRFTWPETVPFSSD